VSTRCGAGPFPIAGGEASRDASPTGVGGTITPRPRRLPALRHAIRKGPHSWRIVPLPRLAWLMLA